MYLHFSFDSGTEPSSPSSMEMERLKTRNEKLQGQVAGLREELQDLREALIMAEFDRDRLKDQLDALVDNHEEEGTTLVGFSEIDSETYIPNRQGEFIDGIGFVPLQSEARPYGLEIAGLVRDVSTDERSRKFRDEILPGIIEYMQTTGREVIAQNDLTISPDQLILENPADLRAYFIGEQGQFNNSIGFNLSGRGIETGSPKLVFPNASQAISAIADPHCSPLQTGDFVDLGRVPPGTPLDLFLISNGVHDEDAPVYTADPTLNPDNADHLIVHGFAGDTILVGFEDLYGGGDRNFRDVVIALDIGAENVRAFMESDQRTASN
ncbi:MAG: DUF4114 domain-containing protein [Verrucomicrobiota bacterium]